VTERLFDTDRALYQDVKKVLNENKNERHMRGGLATKRKYENLSQIKSAKSGALSPDT